MEDSESSSRVSAESSANFSLPSSEDAKTKRKDYIAKRDSTKVALYEQFQRWRSLKEELDLKTDKQLAEMLLDNYEKGARISSDAETQTNIESRAADLSAMPMAISPISSSTPLIHTRRHSSLPPVATKRRRLLLGSTDALRTQTVDEEETLSAIDSDDSELEDNSQISLEHPMVGIDDIDKVSLEEEVLDTTINGHSDDDADDDDDCDDGDDDDDGTEKAPKNSKQSFVRHIPSTDVPKLELCLASTTIILELLKTLHGPVCTRVGCSRPLNFRNSFVGTCLVVNWGCSAGHFGGRWAAQPTCEGVRAGNLLLASAIPLSGNSYTKIGFLFQVMNVQFISKNLYNQYQNLYIAPAVNSYWEELKNSCWAERENKDIVLSSDGRNDSPGHCAQYCTYTFAEMDSKCILDINFVEVREVEGRKSPNMERIGFERGLDNLLKSTMIIKEVVTDGHLEIGALMKNAAKYKDIVHQRDVWHGAKIIGKKVISAANEKGNEDLSLWIASVRNHFWYSSRNCGSNVDNLKDIWIGILHNYYYHDSFL
ncbi:uncharacterized protein LOC114533974 [Dendronephthya gigantea]|uniref:uncharacterized protein LOC114533974 n=1 Tax=Dendronephthya gigantea TaxID=151771 RepID=UPI00106D9C5F|nr:uncharacterized protein LOC114533974 [Dendronephthya gigantea]